MLYFKVFRDRDFNNFIPIDETEYEKALVAFRFGKPAIFNFGALEKIGDIVPDYHRTMGWNPTYKLGDDDWSDIRSKGIDRKIRELQQYIKEKIDYLIETKREHLLGKGIYVELPKKPEVSSEASKLLADKMKIWSPSR